MSRLRGVIKSAFLAKKVKNYIIFYFGVKVLMTKETTQNNPQNSAAMFCCFIVVYFLFSSVNFFSQVERKQLRSAPPLHCITSEVI